MPEKSEVIRAFIAINLPPEVRAKVEQGQCELRALAREQAVRWVAPGQIHLTLKFLGGVAADSLDGLTAALRRACEPIGPFALSVRGLGCFPGARNPRVIWAGLQGALEVLCDLQQRLERETESWREPEAREFHPHLTLGRVKSLNPRELAGLCATIEASTPFESSPWRVTQVDLMQSKLSPQGAVYARVAGSPLAGSK